MKAKATVKEAAKTFTAAAAENSTSFFQNWNGEYTRPYTKYTFLNFFVKRQGFDIKKVDFVSLAVYKNYSERG